MLATVHHIYVWCRVLMVLFYKADIMRAHEYVSACTACALTWPVPGFLNCQRLPSSGSASLSPSGSASLPESPKESCISRSVHMSQVHDRHPAGRLHLCSMRSRVRTLAGHGALRRVSRKPLLSSRLSPCTPGLPECRHAGLRETSCACCQSVSVQGDHPVTAIGITMSVGGITLIRQSNALTRGFDS